MVVNGEASVGPVELRRKDDNLALILKAPDQDLFDEALPLSNSLPTDSSGANCYALGGKMLYNGFPDGSVVCWAWGAEGNSEWRCWDHDSTASVTCVAAANDGSYASGCTAGRICYKPINSTSDAQRLELAFFRGCRVIDKQRIGTVALTAETSTSKDLYGASFRIRWDGEDNLDEIPRDIALKTLKHYFTVCSLLLTTYKKAFGGEDDRPTVIIGTINGALLAYSFSHHVEGEQAPPAQQIFAMSPFYLVDGLQPSALDDPAALRGLDFYGPPITAISLSADEEGILLMAVGRSDADMCLEHSNEPQLLQVNLKGIKPIKNRTAICVDPSAVGLQRLSSAPRKIAGYSKAAFYICGSHLWCWQYGTMPRRMSDEATGIGLALSEDAQWLATGHSDNSVSLWGPLAQSHERINGNLQWEPTQRYTAIHTMPVQSVAFQMPGENEHGEAMLVSAAADREVHMQRVGNDAFRPPFGANVCIVEENLVASGESPPVKCVTVCGHKRLCCVAVGPTVQLCSLVDLCLHGRFKLLAELEGHEDAVQCMCPSPSNMETPYLFTGSSDNTARIWNLGDAELPSGAKQEEIIGPLVSSVTAIAVDRRSARLLYAGLADGTIEIWEWQAKQQLQCLEFHQQPVLSLSTNASKRLVSGSADNTGVLWDNVSAGGKTKCNFHQETVLRNHDGDLSSVFLGYNQRKIVTGSSDCDVLLWDTEAIERPQYFRGHQAAVTATCTSRDMQTIISADQSGVVIEWDVISGTDRRSFHVHTGQNVVLGSCSDVPAESIQSLVFVEQHVANDNAAVIRKNSLDVGKWLIIATPSHVRVMRMDGLEKIVRKGHIHYVSCVAMSADSTVVVSASWDGMLVLWDAVNKTQLMTFKGHLGPVFCCDISDDKRYVFSGSADTNIFIWDCNEAGKKKILAGYHDDPVKSLKNCPADEGDVARFVTGSTDHKVNLFGMAADGEARLLALFQHSSDIWCVIGPRTASGNVGIGTADGEILLWKPNVKAFAEALCSSPSFDETKSINTEMQMTQPYTTLRYHKECITSVYFSNQLDGERLLATSADGEASVWSNVTGRGGTRMIKTFAHQGRPSVTVGRFSEKATSSDTLLVILGCSDSKIYIWDYLSHTIEKVLAGHTGPVCDLEISIDSRVLISAARERRVLRWGLVRGTAETLLRGHADGVVVAEVSAQSQKVVTGAKDNRIVVWNTVGPSAGKPALDLILHSGNVSCLALSKSGSQLLSGSWDTTVCFVDLLTPQVIRRFRGHIGAVLSCVIGGSDGREDIVVSCCRAGRLIRWNLETGNALWNVSLGGPGRCLVFHAPSLLICGCDQNFALQVWDAQQAGYLAPQYLKRHKGEISGVVLCFEGRMLCSSDYQGTLVFWEAERENFDVKTEFTCELMESGIESLAVEGSNLVCSTRESHVLLFEIDETVGLLPGKMPRRVWQHHLDRVPCVRLLAHGGGPLKIVTASYDNRVFIHPADGGTALWFSWRPVMNAVRKKNYSLFRELLSNQRMIVHEKVYPIGWTLLHALTELGDLKAIQILFDIAGEQPLGFTKDASGKTPLDIGLDYVQTGILNFLLSQAKRWPQHVLEFSTSSICKLINISLVSMPAFLDSRVLTPLPDCGIDPPTESFMSSEFNSAPQQEYFEPFGMGGSLVPSLSQAEYSAFGIAQTARAIASDPQNDVQNDDEPDTLPSGAAVPWSRKLKSFSESTGWMAFLMIIILADVSITFTTIFADIEEDDLTTFQMLNWIIISIFAVDIVIRVAADQMDFFNGPNRYTNNFEFIVVIICFVSEMVDTVIPVSLGRLIRPILRFTPRLSRIIISVFFLSTTLSRPGTEGTLPITTSCVFLHGVLDHGEGGILHYIVTSRQQDLFKSFAVKAILEYKWRRFARRQHLRNFAIYLFYACCWTCYTVITYMNAKDSVERKYKDMLAVILFVFGIWYTVREMRKLVVGGILSFVSSGWNLLNFFSNCIVVACVSLESIDAWAFGNDNSVIAREVSAIVSTGVWIQSFHYLRGFRGTAALVRMIQEILLDIKFFLLIMFIMTIAFTQAFFILEDVEIGPLEEPYEILWKVYNTAWLGAQWTWYTGPVLQRLIYFFMTFFQLVVLMNMLIAIMGDTFGRVKEGATIAFYQNFAQLIHELEVLMTPYERKDKSKFPHYLLFSQNAHRVEVEDFGEADSAVEDTQTMHSILDQIGAEIKSLRRNISNLEEAAAPQEEDPRPTIPRSLHSLQHILRPLTPRPNTASEDEWPKSI